MVTLLVGSGSSGSTLLAQLLDNHNEIACGAELGLFSKPILYNNFKLFREHCDLIRKYGISSNPYFEDRSVLRNLDGYSLSDDAVWEFVKQSASIEEFIYKMEWMILTSNKKHIWIEKSPENIYLSTHFIAKFPNAKIIHIVRDPRDVILSFLNRGHSSITAAEVWITSIAALQPMRGNSCLLEVKYEDLVCNPNQVLKKISMFLTIEWKPSVFFDYPCPSPKLKRSEGLSTWRHKPIDPISTEVTFGYKKTNYDFSYLNQIRLSDEFARLLDTQPFFFTELSQFYGYSMSWSEAPVCQYRPASVQINKNCSSHPFHLYETEPFVNRILI